MLRLCWALARLARALLVWLAGLPRRAAVGLGAPLEGQPTRPEQLWRAVAITLPAALLVHSVIDLGVKV